MKPKYGSWLLPGLTLLVSYFAKAQLSTGDKYLGGTLSLQTQDAPNSPNGGLTNEVRSFSVYPSMGFLVKNNLAVGGFLGYSAYSSKITNTPSSPLEYSSQYYSVGIFARRFFNLSENFLFTVTASGNFERGYEERNYNLASNGSESQLYQWVVAIRPGLLFFPSSNWGIEASIGTLAYMSQMNLSTEEKSNSFNMNYGNLSLGFAYYFRR